MFHFNKQKKPTSFSTDTKVGANVVVVVPEQPQPVDLNEEENDDDNDVDQKQLTELKATLQELQKQIAREKAGKRKIFHSLVKIASELKRTQQQQQQEFEKSYHQQPWYEGGIWRNQVQVLPSIIGSTATKVNKTSSSSSSSSSSSISSALAGGGNISELFFDLVIVTAFTRVGEAISTRATITGETVLYFAVFWTIWSKEMAYSSRFDTSDLSAKMSTLLTCFAVLFGSLSASASPMASHGASRIMMVAAFCAILHCLLHLRIALVFGSSSNNNTDDDENNNLLTTETMTEQQKRSLQELRERVRRYGIFNTCTTLLEAVIWIVGIVLVPVDSHFRWLIFVIGILSSLRLPRAFLANDFHAACTKRGVLFILLLGFVMQSIVVIASEFFAYLTPSWEQYSFIGTCCLILFCIKLLYVDDSNTAVQDHALLINQTSAFLFSIGHFCLLFSTTVMGSGLNLVTHEFLAATAALPSTSKQLVAGGFAAVIMSNFFIKSMHIKRVPADNSRHRIMFVTAYVTEMIVTLAVVTVCALMGHEQGGPLQFLEQNGPSLIFFMSALAVFLVVISWLDQGVELSLYDTVADSLEVRVEPFGFWSCCFPASDEDVLEELAEEDMSLSRRFSVLAPLLGASRSSTAFLKAELKETEGYGSVEEGLAYRA